MRNFAKGIFETHKRSFISAFSICMTVPLAAKIVYYKISLISSTRKTYLVGQVL